MSDDGYEAEANGQCAPEFPVLGREVSHFIFLGDPMKLVFGHYDAPIILSFQI